jgi:hypothetical protein
VGGGVGTRQVASLHEIQEQDENGAEDTHCAPVQGLPGALGDA